MLLKTYKKEWLYCTFSHLPRSKDHISAIILTFPASEQCFVHSIIMSGAQSYWCSHLFPLVLSVLFVCLFLYLQLFSLSSNCYWFGRNNGVGAKQILFLSIKTLWSFQRIFLYSPLLLMANMMLARKYLSSHMPMVVMMEREISMTLNPCTILYLYFKYTWYWGTGGKKREIVKIT